MHTFGHVLLYTLCRFSSASWSYEGDTGPSFWPELFEASCNGTRQSPIDIVSHSSNYNRALAPLTLSGYSRYPRRILLGNNGFTARLTIGHELPTSAEDSQRSLYAASPKAPQPKASISDGGLSGTYVFSEVHFHWGSESSLGSEHRLNGRSFPLESAENLSCSRDAVMINVALLNGASAHNCEQPQLRANLVFRTADGINEAHLVHYHISYGDITLAKKRKNGLAVLAVFFEISKDDNIDIQPLIDGLPHIRYKGLSVRLHDPLSLSALLPPHAAESYYRYWGSLTTPSCYESVIWTVFPTPINISERQINKFRLLKDIHVPDARLPFGEDPTIYDNFRPPQPLNNRRVFRSLERLSAEPKSPSASASVPIGASGRGGQSEAELQSERRTFGGFIVLLSFAVAASAIVIAVSTCWYARCWRDKSVMSRQSVSATSITSQSNRNNSSACLTSL